MQAVEQLVDELRPLDEIAHEQEERNRDQHVVRHHTVGPLHEQVKHLPIRERRIHAAVSEPRKEDTHPHERERGRKPEHDAHADQREHEQAQGTVG